MANPNTFGGQLYNEGVSAVTATNTVLLGSRRHEAGIDYLYVYNASSNEQITTGRGAKLASASTGYSVDVAVAAANTFSAAVLCGVCIHSTLTTGTYGWLATRGFMQIENFGATSIGKGEPVMLHTSGAFTRITAPTANAIFRQDVYCGLATEDQTTTTTGSFTAYIWSRFA